jgi:hypothetical protein
MKGREAHESGLWLKSCRRRKVGLYIAWLDDKSAVAEGLRA